MLFKYIIIPIIIGIISQSIKIIIEYFDTKKIDFMRFFDGMGGMPSTHSAVVSSISTLVYIDYGISSVLFSITLIFSLIVIYDSMGIRYECSKQAKIINEKFGTDLKDKLGHKPIEVLVGIILGMILSYLFNYII